MRSREKVSIGKIIIILLVINRLYVCKYGRFWSIVSIKKLHQKCTDPVSNQHHMAQFWHCAFFIVAE